MFNALEFIASCEKPVTPVLECRISKALEPLFVLDDVRTAALSFKYCNLVASLLFFHKQEKKCCVDSNLSSSALSLMCLPS